MARPFYALVHMDGTLVGGIACYQPRIADEPRYNLQKVLGTREAPRPRETCLLGGRSAYRAGLRLHPGLGSQDRAAVRCLLLDAAARTSSEAGRRAVVMYAPAGSVPLDGPGGGSTTVSADATIHLPGSSYDDWLASLSSSRRAKVRRERASFQSTDADLEEEPLTELADECAPLLAALRRRHGQSDHEEALRKSLRAQGELFGERAVVFAARTGGELGAFALGIHYRDGLFMRAAGFDADLNRHGFAYFNLIYRAIEHACANGLPVVHLGMGSLLAKVHRGAVVTRLVASSVGWSLPEPAASDTSARTEATIRAQLGEERSAPPGAP